MTNEEAVKWIDGRILELVCSIDITRTDTGMKRINEEYGFLRLAREAIGKQIQLKPAVIEAKNPSVRQGRSGVHWRKMYTCPACAKIMYVQNQFDFDDGFDRWPAGSMTAACPTCGQALKWR